MHARNLGRRAAVGRLSEQGESRGPLPTPERAVDQVAQHRLEVGRVAYPHGRTGLGQGGRVGQPMPGYAPVTGDGQAAGECLQRGEPAGVLHEDVGGVHQGGHVVDPAEVLEQGAPQALEPESWLRDMQARYTTPEQHALHQQGSTAADAAAVTFF